jgi:hypothetical protein
VAANRSIYFVAAWILQTISEEDAVLVEWMPHIENIVPDHGKRSQMLCRSIGDCTLGTVCPDSATREERLSPTHCELSGGHTLETLFQVFDDKGWRTLAVSDGCAG